MSTSKSNVLIFGATGLIGTYIFNAILTSKSKFGRIAVFTREETATKKADLVTSLKDQGVEFFLGDLTKEQDVLAAYEGIDTVISCLGRSGLQHQIDLMRWAESTGCIKRFIPSEYGTDIEFGPESKHEKPHQQKLKTRKYIREETSKLDGFFLVTGPYFEGFVSKSSVEGGVIGSWDVVGRKAVIVGEPGQRIAFSMMPDVGTLLVAALLHPTANKNTPRYPAYKVCSFVTTQQDILSRFESLTDSKWDVKVESLEELKATEKSMWDGEQPAATGATLRRIWAAGGTIYEKWDSDSLIEGWDEGAERRFDEGMAKAVKAQEGGQ